MYSKNSKITIRLDSFSKQIKSVWVNKFKVFGTTALLYLSIYSIFLWFLLPYRVTDKVLIVETAVWPILFLSYKCFLCS